MSIATSGPIGNGGGSSSSFDASDGATATLISVGAYVALTLQLLRLSMDFVQVATLNAQRQGSSTSSKKPKGSGGGDTKKTATATKDYYGSADSAAAASVPSDENGGDGGGDEEEQHPLLRSSSSSSSTYSSNSNLHPYRGNYCRTWSFTASWISIAALYAFAASFWNSSSSHPPPPPPVFPATLLVVSLLSVLVQLWLHLRDARRQRYGCVQRFFQLASSLALWTCACVVVVVAPSGTANPLLLTVRSPYHAVVLFASTGFVAASALDGALLTDARRSRAQRRRSSKIASHPEVFARLLKPYFWPDATDASAVSNRVRAVATWICVVAGKACGLVSPLFLGWATTSLAHSRYGATIRYSCLYALVSFLGASFKEGQSLVYLKVAQAAFVQLSEAAFGHLHSLSLDWHLRKKLGETLRAMDRGIAACDTLMKYLFLWLIPAMAECLIVVVIFATYFHYLPLALTVFYFVFVYVLWTILVTLWRKKFRKALVQSDNEYHDIFTDSMVNFETVKHFTAEEYEKRRFTDAVARYQAGSVSVQASLSFLNLSQQIILKICLAVALSLAAVGIRQRGDCCLDTAGCDSVVSDCCLAVGYDVCPGMTVGDFVAVLTYTLNLFAPLNFLGSVYNAIVMAIIDLSSMSELLAEQPDVVDAGTCGACIIGWFSLLSFLILFLILYPCSRRNRSSENQRGRSRNSDRVRQRPVPLSNPAQQQRSEGPEL